MTIRILSTFLSLAALSACSTPVGVAPTALSQTDEVNARSAVKAALKDPYSAQFGAFSAFQLDNGDRVYCGKVNAKNSYGGYIGYQTFFVRKRGNSIERVFIDDYQSRIASIGCRAAASGKIGIGQ